MIKNITYELNFLVLMKESLEVSCIDKINIVDNSKTLPKA
jgi:hypothetical protein